MARRRLPLLLAILAPVLLLVILGQAPAREPEPATPLARALAALRAAETCDDEAVGYAGAKSDTYKAYEVLRDTAPVKLLRTLVDDDHAIVRCYAFRALVEKHPDEDVFAILWRRLDDDASVKTFRGCIMSTEKVGDVLIQGARDRLSDEQDRRILERLIRSGSPLDERGRMLRTRTVPATLLPDLRRLADEGDDDALVALSRHGRPEDVARILDRLRDTKRSIHPQLIAPLRAARLHPDPRLLPALEALAPRAREELGRRQPIRLRFYFQALAAQTSPRAAKLLEEFLDLGRLSPFATAQLAQTLFEAVRESAAKTHVPLQWRLWEERGRLDAAVARHLHRLDPARVLSRAKRDLRGDPNRLEEDAVDTLVDLLAEADRESAISVVATALPQADVHRFGVLARHAGRWKSDALVEPLFAAYATNDNPHVYLAAARALLAYDVAAIDARLETGARELRHLGSGWGAEALRELLASKPRGD